LFDTFKDQWDPSDYHIGVDINNIASFGNYSQTLPKGSFVGRVMSAQIDYDGGTGQLSVVLRNGSSDGATYNLSANVDLRTLLPDKVIIGFSAATDSKRTAMHYVLSWSFSSTSIEGSQRRRTGVSLVAGVTAATVLALLLSTVVGVMMWRSRRKEQSTDDEDDPWSIDEDLESGSGPRPFQLSKLTAATRNFAEKEKLGQGASGSVYRGRVDELDVAIKVFSRAGSAQGKREYTAEVTVISRLRHRNLVHLIGWCDGRKKLLLVYELVPNGSLDRHLHSATAVLAWLARHRIILGLGAAVLYLHEEWGQCVIHGDIKPSNIMLDESFDAKLGDFGLARLMDHGVGLQTMTAVAGTPGYLDPECLASGKASAESDVYSFGVVLLEVATGRRPMAPPPPGDKRIFRLVEWVWGLYGRAMVLHAADEALSGVFDAQEMELVLVVGLWCAHPDATARPSIREAVEALRSGEAAKLPRLPPRMPVAIYVQPYDPIEKYVVVDDSSRASTSVKANLEMSSHDYADQPLSTDEHQIMFTSSSSPPSGSKQSVRLLRGR
jgi:serine/threonine protein kinase